MSRSIWKSPYIELNILNKINNYKNGDEKIIYTNSRSTIILKSFVGWTFYIHKGNSFTKLLVTNEMIFFKLGEFSFSRKIGKIHTSKDKKLKK